MTPAQARASLDSFLAGRETCKIQRLSGSPQVTKSVTLKAAVKNYTPQDIIAGSGLQAGDSHVIISTTEIDAAQWPDVATLASTTAGDPRIPVKGDRFVLSNGRVRTVQAAWPAPYVDGELIRIEMTVR